MSNSLGKLDFDFIVLSPPGKPDPALAIAGARAGAVGVLNLEFCEDAPAALAALERLAQYANGRFGVLLDGESDALLREILERGPANLNLVLLTCSQPASLPELIELAQAAPRPVFVLVSSWSQAEAAIEAGTDGLVAKGHEAGGWVEDETAFVLQQRLIARAGVPVWAYGGVGLHTVAASYVAGAAGAVLDNQLLLARESPLPETVRARIGSMDGSEALCLGASLDASFRVYTRPDLRPLDDLRRLDQDLTTADMPREERRAEWRSAIRARVGWEDLATTVLPLGQDAALARGLAARFKTVGGIVAGLRESLETHCLTAQAALPLAEGAPLAQAHGTRYPIVQGPMTRVSDRAQFAAAVAEGGALPFLALALMRAGEVEALLRETTEQMGDKPWGIGILGFVPVELREEQMAVIRRFSPNFVLIAGGRPDQARALESDGIPTYLHVPSPGLLDMFLKDGARRFVFEGRECGGHTGPRTSFVLWDSMVEVLLQALAAGADPEQFHVLFAGGVHDGRSAAMVSAIAGPLAERGVRIGVLVGTAYLFTTEAVGSGAITPGFQRTALECDRTVLLESGPGQTTRCAPSPFVQEFEEERRRLMLSGLGAEELKNALEILNIGRLRIASKGVDHDPRHQQDASLPKLMQLEPETQWARGMYMIGQIAALRDKVLSVAELHGEISRGSVERLAGVVVSQAHEAEAPPPAAIAIVGMGCIMPGASDLRAFWDNILNEVDAISEVPASRWDWRRYYDADRSAPDKTYSRWGGFVPDVPFDPVEFGMPPSTLPSIEPFQLLALATVRAALRDAGYLDRPMPRERTSVVLGAGGGGGDLTCGYITRTSLPALFGAAAGDVVANLDGQLPAWTEDSFAGLLMNVAAGRIANRFDFGGLNYTVDAACASSLAAVYLSVRDLENHTSDVAVVGGIDALENPFTFLCFSKTQAHSPTGRCRTFDATADGIAISEGFGALVLKRLEDAERDGDRIYGVIRGVGGASDGRDRSLTAPRPEGQIRALRRAYAQARFDPASVGLIEAHGTGTVAGDQAEIEALTTFFSESGSERQSCAVGSVKSMIGHTKATAGVAGLIKIALSLYHGVLPATLGVTEPNPKANFPASPFYVNSETRPWIRGPEPRRAGVSSFGFGGTDFHVALEEYNGEYLPHDEPVLGVWPAELCLWRGTPDSIAQGVSELAAKLALGAKPALADVAFTLASRLPLGSAEAALAIVATSIDDLAAKLQSSLEFVRGGAGRQHSPHGVHYVQAPLTVNGKVAFLFPGQGSQYVNMLRDLTVVLPETREPFDLAGEALAGRLARPLPSYIFPRPCFHREDAAQQEAELTATDIAQPALGVADLAMLRVLRSFGVEPHMVAGHSYGEFVALCAAGCIDERTLLQLSEARGRFIVEGAAGGDAGTMAAIDAPADALQELAADAEVTLANFNAPRQTVLSGSHEAVDRAVAWCERKGLRAHRLNVACAFHSPLVGPAQRRLAERLSEVSFAPPRYPVYSNTTAGPYPDQPGAIASILSDHLVQPVQFVRQIEEMYRDGARVFVEVGPKNTLTTLTSRILGDRPHLCVPLDQPGRPGLLQLLHGLAALLSEGVTVDTDRLFKGRAVQRLDLAKLDETTGLPAYSPTTWLVNGGGARPATKPERVREPVRIAVLGEGEVVAPAAAAPSNGNGHAPAAVAGSPAGDGVLEQFELVMQRFLDTQRSVMTAYLSGRPATTVPPAADIEIPAVSAVQEAPLIAEPLPIDAPVPSETPKVGGRQEIVERLLEVVSDRTGYPADMLALDVDLEADLGIDSIKRVEIAGTLVQLLRLGDQNRPDMEQLAASRTLGQVVDHLELLVSGGNGRHDVASPTMPAADGAAPSKIARFTVLPVLAPAIAARAGLAPEGVVVIIGDGDGVGLALAEHLAAEGRRAVRVVSGSYGQQDDILVASTVDSQASAAALVDQLHDRFGKACALVYLRSLRRSETPALDFESWRPELANQVTGLFLLAQALRQDLAEAAAAGGAAVLGATAMGGTYAIEPPGCEFFPGQAGVTGFLKTLARETTTVRVKAVDIAPADPASVASWLYEELFAADGLVEVGYREGQRIGLELAPAPLYPASDEVRLDRDSVVLVTGGARGITAEAVALLAERYQPRLVLVGRTPLSDRPESSATAVLSEPQAIKRALIEELRAAGAAVSPAEIESAYRQLINEREVRQSVARVQASGARFEYRVCDVRDGPAFEALIDDVYARYGRIDGAIHGAGIIEDKLVADKALDSFERVIETKVAGALTLARKLRPESLRFLLLFSSVSGRFGNRGQADYAAASEMLNKLAEQLDRRWPGRVVAINWGPWQKTGMVSAEVQRQFAERGIELIPVEAGCRMLDEELRGGRKGEAEVLIGGGQEAASAGQPASASSSPPLPSRLLPLLSGATITRRQPELIEVNRTFDLGQDLYLDDHRLDGRPVLPFAFACELMAEVAAAGWPELTAVEVRQQRWLKGIVLDGPDLGSSVPVRIVARIVDSESPPHVEVSVLSDVEPVRGHYRATVVLRPAIQAEVVEPWTAPSGAFPMSVAAAYEEWLFHGPIFQRISSIQASGPEGAVSLLSGSSPADCLRRSDGNWLFDPVLIDNAFQIQVLWARQHWDVTLLPSSVQSYRQFGSVPPGPIRHELRIRPESQSPSCHADHYFYGPDGRLVLAMTDVEGTGSKALNRLASREASLAGAK